MSERDQLVSRIDSLQSALDELQTLADESPGVAATLHSLALQQHALEERLAELARTEVIFKLDGAGVRGHEIDAGVLGKLLYELQQTVSALGQGIVTRATRVGPMDRDLIGATTLNFKSSFAGSVGIELRGQSDANGIVLVEVDSLLDMSTTRLIEALMLVTDDDAGSDLFLETVLPWGTRAFKHLRLWARTLVDGDVNASLSVRSEAGNRAEVALDAQSVKRLTRALDLAAVEDTEVTLEGHLGTVSDFRNRVEIVTAAGEVLTARVDEQLVPHLGDFYAREVRAIVELHITKEKATGLERTFRMVRDLSLVDEERQGDSST